MVLLGGSCSPCCQSYGVDSLDVFSECFPGFSVVTNIKDDVTKLAGLKLVFAGHTTTSSCLTAVSVRFVSTDYAAVKDWIESGGRLVLFSEFDGCLQDPATLITFLADLGSTMSWVGGVYNEQCHDLGASPPRDRRCTPGVANIAQGLTNVYMAASAEISGGTSIFFSSSGKLIFAVEKLGNGFLFLSGDANIGRAGAGCPGLEGNNCQFLKRLYDYADDAIL